MLNSYYTDDINNNKIPEELIESYVMHLQNIDNIEYFEPLIREELFKCKQELRATMVSDAEAVIMAKQHVSHLLDMN